MQKKKKEKRNLKRISGIFKDGKKILKFKNKIKKGLKAIEIKSFVVICLGGGREMSYLNAAISEINDTEYEEVKSATENAVQPHTQYKRKKRFKHLK